eukprot:UN13475
MNDLTLNTRSLYNVRSLTVKERGANIYEKNDLT